jgi:hypothetical protein
MEYIKDFIPDQYSWSALHSSIIAANAKTPSHIFFLATAALPFRF